MVRVYVSIGSNIEPERNVRGAIQALRARFGEVRASPVYQCPPEGFDGAHFYNLVAGFETDDPPQLVADALAEIERAHGRARLPGVPSRTLDLDLLLYGDRVVEEGGLRLPRADIGRYAFVLKPLADLAPHARHPETRLTYAEMWEEFRGETGTMCPVRLSPPL